MVCHYRYDRPLKVRRLPFARTVPVYAGVSTSKQFSLFPYAPCWGRDQNVISYGQGGLIPCSWIRLQDAIATEVYRRVTDLQSGKVRSVPKYQEI